jgi:hypothetical protein
MNQRRNGGALGNFCTPSKVRVKKDGKLSDAATTGPLVRRFLWEFRHLADRPGSKYDTKRLDGLWAGDNRGRGICEFWGRLNADAG